MGYDIAKDVTAIAVTNLLLATGDLFKEQIQRKDTLHENIDETYDIILGSGSIMGNNSGSRFIYNAFGST